MENIKKKMKSIGISVFLFGTNTMMAYAVGNNNNNNNNNNNSNAGGDFSTFNNDMKSLLSTPKNFKVGFYSLIGIIILIVTLICIYKYISAVDEHERIQIKKQIKSIFGAIIGIPIFISLILSLVKWRLGVSINF